MAFDPRNPFGDEEQAPVGAVPPSVREQILASLQQRMAPVPAPDTSALEAEASEARGGSGLARMGIQLSNAFMGRQSKGDNNFSKNLDADAAEANAGAEDLKRKAAEADKRREELRNGLSTRFVDDENLKARDKTKADKDDADYTRSTADKTAAAKQQHAYDMELARLKLKEGAGAKADAKLVIENDKNQQKLGKDLGPLQETYNALGEVEAAMGGPLENFAYDKKGNAILNGKKVDLPGVNIPGIGATSFFSQEARNLDDTMARVFNQTLKVRSGAAVTDNELARLKAEFSAGKFNTEAEKVKALQDVKRLLKDSFNNVEAKYNKDVVGDYKTRGGQTSDMVVAPPRSGSAMPPPPAFQGKPTTVIQDGHTFTLNPQTGEYE